MNKDFLHSVTYIDWRIKGVRETVTIEQMKELKNYYIKNGIEAVSKTRIKDWSSSICYRMETKGYYEYLYVKNKNLKDWFHIYSNHTFDDSKNVNKPKEYVGLKSNRAEQKLFKEFNGVTERVAFGFCDREQIHKCIPKQFYYINDAYKHKNLKEVSKVDYSSHYPDNMRGKMPDWHTKEVVQGTVKPSKEYPFAFYINSGHIAEYKRYDTHKWLDHRLNFCLFGDQRKEIPEDEDITILCKSSKYTFDKTVEYLYEQRNSGVEIIPGITAKMVLNSAIGYKHLKDVKSKKNRFDHIAAVVIARSNQQMIELFDKVGFTNVLQMVVDSVIYKGSYKFGEDVKYLGCLHQEITGATFRMRGQNQYIFIDKDGNKDYRHSGFDKNIKTDDLEDIELWEKEKHTLSVKEF